MLVVDDNALNAKLLRLAFEAQGYVVRVASDAIAASHEVSLTVPSLTLLDVQMPGTDGLTLLRDWRADERLPRFPVVIVSAFAAGADLDRAYAAGADAFVSKPVNIKNLLHIVERIIAAAGDGAGQ